MSEETVSRRSFLGRAATLCVTVAAGGALLAACKSGGGGAAPAAGTCDDTVGVDAAITQARAGLQYVSQAPDQTKRCDACMLWTAPTGGSGCGGCTALAGPINPAGTCSAFTRRA